MCIIVGWGELGCVECRNHSNHTLADSPGAKDDCKTSKLGPDLPLGVHDRPQCAEIGANPFTLLLGPNQRKPGTGLVAVPIHGNPVRASGSIVPAESFPGAEKLIPSSHGTLLNDPRRILKTVD